MASPSHKEELLMSIAHCSLAQARTLLEVANGSVDEAVNLFMEGTGSQEVAPPPGSRTELLEEEVRAPIPSKMERMLDDEDEGHETYVHHLAVRKRGQNAARDPFRSFAAERKERQTRDGPALPQAKGEMLAALFRPPLELMFVGSFEQAKQAAEQQQKLLLVNIQTPTEFGCQMLNRDTWRDEKVRQLVKERFVLWQQEDSTPGAQKFKQFYDVALLPHISVLDPLTGERLESWEGFIGPEHFVQEMSKMRHGSTPAPTLKPKRKSIADLTEEEQMAAAIAASKKNLSNDGGAVSVSSDSVEEVSEVKSREPKKQRSASDTPKLTNSKDSSTAASMQRAVSAELPSQAPDRASSFKEKTASEKAPSEHTEPEDPTLGKEGECVLQVRLKDGRTLQGRFQPTATVSRVQSWVSKELRDSGSKDIALFALASSFPRVVYAGDKAALTLVEAKLTPRAALFVQDV